MSLKEFLKYIVHLQEYRIAVYDSNMNVLFTSEIIENDVYNRVNKDNEPYLEYKVIGIFSTLKNYIEIAVQEDK